MRSGKFFALSFAAALFLSLPASARATDDPGTVKEEIAADKEAIKAQHEEIKANAREARAEEKTIRNEIRQALQAGDHAKAEELKKQLGETHRENVAEKRQDRKELHKAKKELNQDTRAARKARRAKP